MRHKMQDIVITVFLVSGVVGGGATEVSGDRIRGVLQHDRRGGPGSVGEEDRGTHHQHRPGQPGETRPGRDD